MLDSALYHCLDDGQRIRYVRAQYRITRPGARLNLLCVSDAAPANTPPSRVSAKSLRVTLGGAGWVISDLRPHTITSVVPPAVLDHFRLDLEPDSGGRVRVPAWRLEARRGHETP